MAARHEKPLEDFRQRNRNVFLNFGLICYGSLDEIEKLQELIYTGQIKLKVIFQTVTPERLHIDKVKRSREDDR